MHTWETPGVHTCSQCSETLDRDILSENYSMISRPFQRTWQYMCCHLHRTCKNVPSLWFIKETAMIHINVGMKYTTRSVRHEKWKMLVWIYNKKKSMIHINSGMKYKTCIVSHPLIQNRYLSTFSLSSVKSVRSAKTKQKSASNTTALYRERRYQL